MLDTALALLRKYYGYPSFRPGQWEVICHALKGRDTLVLMPTGGGKSLCYQIPSLMLPGVTIVVSPLIALMNDQVTALCANGLPAAAVHSNQDEYVNRENLNKAARGELKIIYISPERLLAQFDAILKYINISLFAIDEAHCISQWGHDFRQVYTDLSIIKEKMPLVPVMALTATADRLTRSDIAKSLSLNDPFSWIGSFDRPNISLSVVNDPGKKGRLRVIESLARKYHLDSGIVYCLSRKKTEDMHKSLTEMGIKSVCYHAGLPADERNKAQQAFVNGDVQVVCATIAFGMGIDKSNIRWVVHNNIPGNIESYYQEIGRAGRDGLPAEAMLFYNFADIMMRRNFVEESGQAEINSEKLDFIQRYAEANVCRRRILLSYFSEETITDCGNCDNCRNPKKRINGTIMAQKALSAVIRINSGEAMNTVIDILRASNRSDIIAKGYHQLKTYGAGRDLSSREWHSYILQMIQLGLFEVAYEDNFHLRPTPLGMKVVKGLVPVTLSAYNGFDFGKFKKGTSAKPAPPVLTKEEQLMEKLKEIRKSLASAEGIAPYMIFSDASLQDMVKRLPTDIDAFREVLGAGEVKTVKYGRRFLPAIRKHVTGSASVPVGTSEKETLILFNAGKLPQEIAAIKQIDISTVYSHLGKWADKDEPIDFRRLLPEADFVKIRSVLDKMPEEGYEILRKMGFRNHQIRIANTELSYRNRHKG